MGDIGPGRQVPSSFWILQQAYVDIITCKAEHSEPVVQADQLLIEFCFTLSDQIVGEIWVVD